MRAPSSLTVMLHVRRAAGDVDLDSGRLVCVALGVGDRFLGDPVEGGLHSRREVAVRSPRQLDVDAQRVGAVRAETFDVGKAMPGAATAGCCRRSRRAPTMVRISARVWAGFAVDDLERSVAPSGETDRGEEQPGLGLDRYRGDMVGDRVVKFPGQQLALVKLGLLDQSARGPAPVADCSPRARPRTAAQASPPIMSGAPVKSVRTLAAKPMTMTASPTTMSRPAPHRNSE